jgi:signal transduction histidine kinase
MRGSLRSLPDDRDLKPEDIEDLRLLISPEARSRGVFLRWQNALSCAMPLRATAVRQIALNLALNACQASPRDHWVSVSITQTSEAIVLEVEDVGPGMPPAAVAMLTGTAQRLGSRPMDDQPAYP